MVEIVSIILNTNEFNDFFRSIGLIICLCGIIIFALSVSTMKDNWRAGISLKDNTQIVTTGIY